MLESAMRQKLESAMRQMLEIAMRQMLESADLRNAAIDSTFS